LCAPSLCLCIFQVRQLRSSCLRKAFCLTIFNGGISVFMGVFFSSKMTIAVSSEKGVLSFANRKILPAEYRWI
jgi:hypothetical protein